MSAADLFPGTDPFTRYAAEFQIDGVLVGGIPKDPDVIKGFLKARLDMGDADLIELAQQTYAEMTAAGEEPPTDDLADAVARKFEGGNGFKHVDGQLVYEGRCMKAALKEASNICYPGTDWPGQKKAKLRKGLKNAAAERVFIVERFIPLGVTEPSRTEQRVKHVTGPQGPRSAINVVDVVEKPLLCFTVAVLDDFIPAEAWGRIWQTIEQNGVGADRARGDGTGELIRWDRLT